MRLLAAGKFETVPPDGSVGVTACCDASTEGGKLELRNLGRGDASGSESSVETQPQRSKLLSETQHSFNSSVEICWRLSARKRRGPDRNCDVRKQQIDNRHLT